MTAWKLQTQAGKMVAHHVFFGRRGGRRARRGEKRKKQQTFENGRDNVMDKRWLRVDSKHRLKSFGKKHTGRTRYDEKSRPKWRSINLVPKVFGLCVAETGTKMDESMQAGDIGHE